MGCCGPFVLNCKGEVRSECGAAPVLVLVVVVEKGGARRMAVCMIRRVGGDRLRWC